MIFHQLNCFFVLALVCLCPLTLFAKPTVVVSIPPQKAFVQAVAGDEVEVVVLMQPGQNPSSFTISPRQLAALSKAEIYFSIGVPMEAALLPRLQANFPGIQIVDTSAGIRKRSLEDHVHSQGDTIEAHAHTKDPHIWLSPGLVKVQIRHYTRALKALAPGLSTDIDQNQTVFLNELEHVDTQLKLILRELRGATVFVYHPAFGYFLERYGLRQETVELQGKQPSPKQLRLLIKQAKKHEVRTLFVQPQFERHAARALAKAINGKVETMDPLAENYLDNLIRMGETIASSYR